MICVEKVTFTVTTPWIEWIEGVSKVLIVGVDDFCMFDREECCTSVWTVARAGPYIKQFGGECSW